METTYCGNCGGRGIVAPTYGVGDGSNVTCPVCKGTGRIEK